MLRAVAGLAFVATALLILAATAGYHAAFLDAKLFGASAEGRVTGLERVVIGGEINEPASIVWRPVVEFTDAFGRVWAVRRNVTPIPDRSEAEARIGTAIGVVYDPDDPGNRAFIDASMVPILMISALMVVLAIPFVMAGILLLARRG